jgi:prepilin-type N-terminal cleavage/methylation domain-containing protein
MAKAMIRLRREEPATKTNRGFSLLELLIVVAIILIIAVIALPSLMRSRQAANESSAISNLRTINSAEVSYLGLAQGTYGRLRDLVGAGLLDSRFMSPSLSGYIFDVTFSGGDYTATATPTSTNNGRFGYYSVPDAVLRYQTSVTATCNPCFPSGQSGVPVQ